MYRADDSIAFALPDTTDAPRIARREAEYWLRARGTAAPVVNSVLLVVSELVTNAVRHTTSEPELELAWRIGNIRVSVRDTEPTGPDVRSGDAGAGFGLKIVAHTATAWGWEPTPDGKIVWADVAA